MLRLILACIVIFTLITASPAFASTPTPQPGGVETSGTPISILGILVLLAPAVWMVWQKFRPNATMKRRSSCCLPVIDGDQEGQI